MIGLGLSPPELATRGGAAPVFDFGGGVLPPGATLTRASAGSRFDAGGRLVMEAANVARFDHDPLTLAPRGLLVEPQATNLRTWSEAFDNGAWVRPGGIAVIADAAVAPDGGQGADRLYAIANNGDHFVGGDVPCAPGTAYTLSFFVKAAGQRYVSISGNFRDGIYTDAVFDTATGTFTGIGGWPAAPVASALGDGWWRLAVSAVSAADQYAANSYALVLDGAAPSDRYYTGDGASGLLFWGWTFEEGVAATSYIPTTAAAATRAADVLTLAWNSRGVADGAITARYTFDDGSWQDVATVVSGGVATVPGGLARRCIRRVEKR